MSARPTPSSGGSDANSKRGPSVVRAEKPIRLVRFEESAWEELQSHDLRGRTELAGPIYGHRTLGSRGRTGRELIVKQMPLAVADAYSRSCSVDTDKIDELTDLMVDRGLQLLGTWHSEPTYREIADASPADLGHWRSWQRTRRPWGGGGAPFLGLIVTPGAGGDWSHPRPTARIIRTDNAGRSALDHVRCEIPGPLGPVRTDVPKPWEL